MNSFPTELIYVLAFAAILLFQYLMKRFGPQEQQEATAQDEHVEQISQEVRENPAASTTSSVTVGYFGRTEAPSACTVPTRRRYARGSLIGTKRAVQNAIVIATILGRCRAYEPHDVR